MGWDLRVKKNKTLEVHWKIRFLGREGMVHETTNIQGGIA